MSISSISYVFDRELVSPSQYIWCLQRNISNFSPKYYLYRIVISYQLFFILFWSDSHRVLIAKFFREFCLNSLTKCLLFLFYTLGILFVSFSRREILSAHDFEEFNRWIEFISVVKKEGTLPELFSLIPINRRYVCIEHNFLPISPLKVAVTLKSKEILKMLKKYGLMDSEEKPELTIKFMKYACKALKWAQRDEEVNNVLHLNSYREQIIALEPFHHPIFGFEPFFGFENLWRDRL